MSDANNEIVGYTVVQGKSLKDLGKQVERLLGRGWCLYGRPFIGDGSFQAMTQTKAARKKADEAQAGLEE